MLIAESPPSRLEKLTKTGQDSWLCCCPCHDDQKPSLSVSFREGRWYASCFAGCDWRDVQRAIPELFDKSEAQGRSTVGRKIVARYDYHDANGKHVFTAIRFEPKDFRQQAADGSWSVKGLPVVPFRLPRLLAADPGEPIFVVEGEKDVLNLERLGLVATCNAAGAGKWRAEHAQHLCGREVIIIPDNDRPGREHAVKVAKSLEGLATSLKVLVLPGLPEKGDVSDWLGSGGTLSELMQLVDEAEPWIPQSKPDSERIVRSSEEPDLLIENRRSENATATEFVNQFGADLRFCVEWRKWLVWDGRRWQADESGVHVLRLARKFADSLWKRFTDVAKQQGVDRNELLSVRAYCRAMNKEHAIRAILELAKADERVTITSADLDSKPLLLNCENGTLDLATGRLASHDREDYLTQLCPVEYHPEADCPKWQEAIDLIFDGSEPLKLFVQKLLGYSCSGDVGEHILPICVGSGANGKSTVWNAVCKLLGPDYASLANDSLLLGDGENHPTDKASLFGKRFVPISEPDHGSKLRESRVKELTGDDTITARRMREDFWTYRRTHKFWLSTNHLPRIAGQDEGIWRRVKIIPFKVDLRKVTKPIPDFAGQLVRDEGPGILAWLVRGFQRWQAEGLTEPEIVQDATATYRADSDPLGDFISEHCVVESGGVVTAKVLFDAYQASGGQWKQAAFGRAMADRFEKVRPDSGEHRKKVVYLGIRLRNADDENTEKCRENIDCPQLPTVTRLVPRDLRNSKDTTGKLWASMGNGQEVVRNCPRCEAKMTPGNWVSGVRLWDCPGCGECQDEIEEAGP